jgi:hypothetical protein
MTLSVADRIGPNRTTNLPEENYESRNIETQ